MFLDHAAECTSSSIDKCIVIKKTNNQTVNTNYATPIKINYKNVFATSYTESVIRKTPRIPASENLKKAMFKMSSKGLLKVLNNQE